MNTAPLNTHLQLKFFQILEIQLKEAVHAPQDHLQVELDFEIVKEATFHTYGLQVSLWINRELPQAKLQGYLSCVVFFEIGANLSDEHRSRLFLENGLALTYSTLRGIIFERASSLPLQSKLLPVVNLQGIIHQKQQQRAY